MLKLNPDSKKSPFGGHHYVDHGVTFRGDSFKEVEKKLTDFRLVNNIPAGNPEQEILIYYSSRWPYLVREDWNREEIETQSQEYLDWREWIYDCLKSPPEKLVSKKEAEERWKVCSKCPFNAPFSWKPSKESAELVRRSFLLRRGMDAPSFLGFCSCHRADLPSFTYFEAAQGFSSKTEEAPHECWVPVGGT